jgi:hypothetical protein
MTLESLDARRGHPFGSICEPASHATALAARPFGSIPNPSSADGVPPAWPAAKNSMEINAAMLNDMSDPRAGASRDRDAVRG